MNDTCEFFNNDWYINVSNILICVDVYSIAINIILINITHMSLFSYASIVNRVSVIYL